MGAVNIIINAKYLREIVEGNHDVNLEATRLRHKALEKAKRKESSMLITYPYSLSNTGFIDKLLEVLSNDGFKILTEEKHDKRFIIVEISW